MNQNYLKQPSSCNNSGNDDPYVGKTMAGSYHIFERLATDDTSIAYRAIDQSTGIPYVLKVIHQRITANVVNSTRLIERARILTTLKHEYIANFYNIHWTSDQECLLICPYLAAKSLEEVLSESGRFSLAQVVAIGSQIAEALDYAHKHKVLHLDIKPSNIYLFNDQDQILKLKVANFGIAALLSEASNIESSRQSISNRDSRFQSTLYKSPEQCAGEKVDCRSDVYSLACLLYEALSGRPPFIGRSEMEIIYKHKHETPPLLNHSLALDQFGKRLQEIISNALQKRPGKRYQSMSELKSDLNILISAEDRQWRSKAFCSKDSHQFRYQAHLVLLRHWQLLTIAVVIVSVCGFLLFRTNLLLSDRHVFFDNSLLWLSAYKTTMPKSTNSNQPVLNLLRELALIEKCKRKDGIHCREKLHELCNYYLILSNWRQARLDLKQLIELEEKVGNTPNLAEAYASLAVCYLRENDLSNAEAACMEALQIVDRTNVTDLIAEDRALISLGRIYTMQANHTKAQEAYFKLRTFWDPWKHYYPEHFAMATALLADALRCQGDLPAADRFYRNSLDWWQNYVNHKDLFIAKALYGLGLVLEGRHHWADAQQQFEKALLMAAATIETNSSFTAAIRQEYKKCLFHTSFWHWLKQS